MWLEGENGERLSAVAQHQRVTVNARVLFMVDVTDPSASVFVYNEEHKAVVVATTCDRERAQRRLQRGEEVVFSFTFDNVLAPGRYTPVFQLAHRGFGLDVIDRFEGGYSFLVTGPGALGGVVDLPVRSTVSRGRRPLLRNGREHERWRRRRTGRSGGRSMDRPLSSATGGASGT